MGTAVAVDLEIIDETGLAEGHLGLIRAMVRRTLETENLDGQYQLSVTVVDDARSRELNATHRGIDSATDVLSFPLVTDDGASFVLPPGEATHLGDIVISFHRAIEQARDYGHSPKREIGYLAVHGTLHLLGYDHEDDEDRMLMRTREEEVLADLPR